MIDAQVRTSGLDLKALERFLRTAQRAMRGDRAGTRCPGACGTVAVRLVDDAAIRALNRDYRGKDAATDVLSFPAAPEPSALRGRRERAHLGDLAVSVETAGRQAAAEGHDLETELRILLLHGILHLAGYDHEMDGGEMRERERQLRRELGLPAGLIERALAEVPESARGRGRVRH